MLDFTTRPTLTTPTILAAAKPVGPSPNFEDLRGHVEVRTDLSPKTRKSYVGAIDDLAAKLNKPLSLISFGEFEERFPRNGFDPILSSSEIAYRLFRRRVQAAVREFLGVHETQTRLRTQEDQWTALFVAVKPLTEGKVGHSLWHPMKLEALKSFALVARERGWQPRVLDHSRAKEIDEAYGGNKRDANRRALIRLDELRAFPEILPFLPPQPIGFTAEARQGKQRACNPVWERQFTPWIDAIMKSGWDPVTETHSDEHEGSAYVMRFALRCLLRVAVDLGKLSPEAADICPVLTSDDTIRAVAAEMFARKDRAKSKGRLAPRTSRKYLKHVARVREHLGIDNALLNQIIANNKVSREGKKAEKEMTSKNRRFCEGLINDRTLRRRFLFSFQTLREAAQEILDRAEREGRDLTRRERSRVRLLGASACFAAIEIGGAPIRQGNAMRLNCQGEDAQIRIPGKGRKPIQVRIPAALVKTRKPIKFDVRYDTFGYYETIRWYFTTIRPLFPHAGSSPFLFPSVAKSGAHFGKGRFTEVFATLMRRIVSLSMTPHQMRHGQVSLLLNANPNEVEVIALRIGDTATTLRTFYGWIDAIRLVERGQDLMIGLMND